MARLKHIKTGKGYKFLSQKGGVYKAGHEIKVFEIIANLFVGCKTCDKKNRRNGSAYCVDCAYSYFNKGHVKNVDPIKLEKLKERSTWWTRFKVWVGRIFNPSFINLNRER